MEPRDNSGALFKNDRKTEDKHPDYSGPARIAGKDWEVGQALPLAVVQAAIQEGRGPDQAVRRGCAIR